MAERNDDLSVRDAGRRIAEAGLDRDVKRRDAQELTQRGRKGGGDSDRDAERDEIDEQDDAQDDDDGAEENADNADESNRDTDDGDSGDDEGDEGEEGQSEDDGEESDEDDEPKTKEATHQVKVDGKVFEVTTSELIAGYQRNRDYQNKTQKLAEKNRELTTGHTKVAEVYARRLKQVGAIYEGVKKLILGDLDSVEMDRLRHTDPARWAVERENWRSKVEKIDAVINGLNSEHERHIGEFEKTRKANLATLGNQEFERVTGYIKDWAKGGKERLGSYLTQQAGFTMAELNEVYDGRMLVVAEKARQWDAYQANKRRELKSSAKKPSKVLKPGSSKIVKRSENNRPQQSAFRKAKDQARKTGSMRDAGKALAHLIE